MGLKSLVFLLLASLLVLTVSFTIANDEILADISPNDQQCHNLTNYAYLSLDYLSTNNYMNMTMRQINTQLHFVTGNEITTEDGTKYRIEYAFYEVSYYDQNQKAYFTKNNKLGIEGGHIKIRITFKWWKQSPQTDMVSGRGVAYGISKQTAYTISLGSSNGGFDLDSLVPITFNDMNITYLDCTDDCPISEEDMFVMRYLMNKIPSTSGVSSIKNGVTSQVNRLTLEYLREYIRGKFQTIDKPQFIYYWYIPQSNRSIFSVTIKRQLLSEAIDKSLPQHGVTVRNRAYIPNFTDAACGPEPLTFPLNANLYGGAQQFISFTFCEQLLKYGSQEGQLNTLLDKDSWTTKNFRYSSQQLEPVLSNISSVFGANAKVTGSCNASKPSINVQKATNSTLMVILNETCQLTINSNKIIEFNVDLKLEVKGVTNKIRNTIDFWMKSSNMTTSYNDSFGHKLKNKALADQLVGQAIDRLYDGKLFGSDWPYFLRRQNPAFMVLENSIVVYDMPAGK